MHTPVEVHHLLCLRLPGNVERAVNRLRSELGRATGALSPLGLPPVIPLAYVPASTAVDVVSRLPQTAAPPLRWGPLRAVNRTLVVAIDLGVQWTGWLTHMSVEPTPSGMPVPLQGVFLGAADLVGELDRGTGPGVNQTLVSNGSEGMPRQLTVLNVELMRLETGSSPQWWDCLDWEVLWTKRIKLRGQAVLT